MVLLVLTFVLWQLAKLMRWSLSFASVLLLRPTPILFPRSGLSTNPCLGYEPPELSLAASGSDPFPVCDMRGLLDDHNVPNRDWLFNLMIRSRLFNPRDFEGKVFVSPDYNQTMEQQSEATMRMIEYLSERGVFNGWLTRKTVEDFRKFALLDVITIFDHSSSIKLGVHFFLW